MNSLLLLTALAAGQMLPIQPGGSPESARQRAEARKEARDQVLRSAGPEAMAFTKQFGDLGIYSLAQCDQPTAKKLVALFHSGELSKLGEPRLALEAIQKHGQPVAAWVVENHSKLTDRDALLCFADEPMEYVFDLKDISVSAEARRTSRKSALLWDRETKSAGWISDPRYLVLAGVAAVALWLVWKRFGNRPTAQSGP